MKLSHIAAATALWCCVLSLWGAFSGFGMYANAFIPPLYACLYLQWRLMNAEAQGVNND